MVKATDDEPERRRRHDQALLEFLQTSYEAAANAANWDRGTLECASGQPGVVRQI